MFVVTGVYVDEKTGEKLGYLYTKGVYSCAVTKEFAIKNNLPDADIIDFINVNDEWSCVKKGDRLYNVCTALWHYDNYMWHNCTRKDGRDVRECYDCDIDEVEVGDYIFKKDQCVILDDEYALRRMITGVEM